MEGPRTGTAKAGRLERLAHFIARYRWPVIAVWVVLTLVGGVAAGKLSTRWYQSTAIPGKPAYEGSQRTLKALGAGAAAAERRRLPLAERRRHEEPGGARGDGAGREGEPARAHELVLLDRRRDVRVARPAHDVPAGLPARPESRST